MLNATDSYNVDVKSYAIISRSAFRVVNLTKSTASTSHVRIAVILITLMVGNLKSYSSSGPWWNNAHAKFCENKTLYACFPIRTNIFLCTLSLNRANTRNVGQFEYKAAQKVRGTEAKATRFLVRYMIKVLNSCYFSFQLLPPVAQL